MDVISCLGLEEKRSLKNLVELYHKEIAKSNSQNFVMLDFKLYFIVRTNLKRSFLEIAGRQKTIKNPIKISLKNDNP